MHSNSPPSNPHSPNSAFYSITNPDSWIELYHSRPSWKFSQISFRRDSDPWIPFGQYQLVDASHIRPGFRAFRLRASRLEFRLANPRATVIDSNYGRNYTISAPGRYVVESSHGCRRVGDVSIPDCLRPLRPSDRYVELFFQSSPTWRRAFVHFAIEGDNDTSTWFKLPMKKRNDQAAWFQRIEAVWGLTCAFSDGKKEWDSNCSANYHVRLPGKYVVGTGTLLYSGPSDIDVHFT